MFHRFFMSIASRRSALLSPLLLCLLPHLLLIFFLHLTLTLLTVTGCGQLNVIDQFPPHPIFFLARSGAKLASPCCIFLVLFFGCPHWVHILFLGAYAFIFFCIKRGFTFCTFLHLKCTLHFCFLSF